VPEQRRHWLHSERGNSRPRSRSNAGSSRTAALGSSECGAGRRELWSVIPDGIFGLSFADGTAAYFMLEVDRGTIPITRNRADHRSIARKSKTYWDAWRAGRHVEQFGLKQMRVATVTNSRERLQHMLAIVRSITDGKGANFFLFIDQESLAAANPLSAMWMTGKGETVKLCD
jgi:hypothetical protein